MNDLTRFVSVASTESDNSQFIEEASQCLDRFTAAFNSSDLAAVDAELYFPHLMISGASRLEWDAPGQHPPGFFNEIKASGWSSTDYVSKQAVLTNDDKVHFLVDYVRKDVLGKTISAHRNLWIVVRHETN